MKYIAYLDPGTGSLFLQAVIGVLLAGAVAFRSFFGRLFAKISQLFSRKQKASDDKDE